MSEEIALTAADLATAAALRARDLEWEDCYDQLAGAFDLLLAIGECQQAMSDYAGGYYDVIMGDLAARADYWHLVAQDVSVDLHAVERELEAARAVVAAARTGFGTEEDIQRAWAFDPNLLTACIRAYDEVTKARSE